MGHNEGLGLVNEYYVIKVMSLEEKKVRNKIVTGELSMDIRVWK